MPTAAKNETQASEASVETFLDGVKSEAQRADAKALAELMQKTTGFEPRMWGPSIVGFGAYTYTYESGRSGTSCAVGFSPRAGKLAIYWGSPGDTTDALLAKLGKHQKGGGCLYVKKLADVDRATLAKLVKTGLANRKKQWPITPR
jgi:hypothetical protein